MTAMQIDRAVVEQALEALEYAQQDRECPSTTRQAIAALRAALAQEQAEAHTTTLRALLERCLSWEPDACVLGNVTARQAVAALRAALAQQDEPAGSVCARCGALAFDPVVPQQAEPLNLTDPAVRKRLATQWGYVPAAQAEPVEPAATLIAQRDALLEALKAMLEQFNYHTISGIVHDESAAIDRARAAIKAVEEGK